MIPVALAGANFLTLRWIGDVPRFAAEPLHASGTLPALVGAFLGLLFCAMAATTFTVYLTGQDVRRG